MTRQELDYATREITSAVCRYMPTAAVASGFMSAVDPKPFVQHVSNLYRYHDRPAAMGVTALTAWLAARGIAAGRAFVKALREDWIICELAYETRKGK